MKIRLTSLNFFDKLIVILFILFSGSVFNVFGYDSYIYTLLFIIVFIYSVFNRFFAYKKNVIYLFLILSSLCFFMFLSALRFNYSVFDISHIRMMILFTLSFLFVVNFVNKRKSLIVFINYLLKIIIIHAIISVFVLTIFPTNNVLFSDADASTQYVGYFYLFFQRVNLDYFGNLDPTFVEYFGFKLQRAHGIFWEPGNFAAYANIFLFLNLYVFKNRNNTIIASLAIILSWSSSGFIVMISQVVYYFLSLRQVKNFISKFIISVFAISLIVNLSFQNLNDKLYGQTSNSGLVRIVNTVISFQTAFEYPLLGAGVRYATIVSNFNDNFSSSKALVGQYLSVSNLDEFSFTNSFMRLFIHFGIIIGLFLLYCVCKQKIIHNNRLLFIFIIILSTSSAPLFFTPFFFIFPISGLYSLINKNY